MAASCRKLSIIKRKYHVKMVDFGQNNQYFSNLALRSPIFTQKDYNQRTNCPFTRLNCFKMAQTALITSEFIAALNGYKDHFHEYLRVFYHSIIFFHCHSGDSVAHYHSPV